MVDRGHLQPDDPAADHQQALGHAAQFQRTGGIDHARVVVRDERHGDHLRAGGDDRLLEADRLLAARRPGSTSSWLSEVNRPVPWTTVTLRALARPDRPPVSFLTTPSFQPRSASMSTVGAAKLMPWCAHLLGLGDHLGGVQQRLGRDAADIEADPAQRRPALDQHHLAAEVGGAEGGGVAAGAGAQHQHLGVEVALAGAGGLGRRGGGGRWPARRRPRAGLAAPVCSVRIEVPSPTRSPTLTLRPATVPAAGDGHVHRRLVALQRQQRVLGLDRRRPRRRGPRSPARP